MTDTEGPFGRIPGMAGANHLFGRGRPRQKIGFFAGTPEPQRPGTPAEKREI